MQCPFIDKPHDCAAIDLYHQNMIYYPNPCTADCNMIRIKQLEEKMKFSSQPSAEVEKAMSNHDDSLDSLCFALARQRYMQHRKEIEKMLFCDELKDYFEDKIKIEQNTAGDSRVSNGIPTIKEFDHANQAHQEDVKHLAGRFMQLLNKQVVKHDWSKTEEPYRSMFYNDMCADINGVRKFADGEWNKKHYNELERHHLRQHVPDDVNLFDVIEMMCDCIAAGFARSSEVYDLDIDPDVLMTAFDNTVELMKKQVEVVDKYGVEVSKKDTPMKPESGASFHGESWSKCPRCGKSFEYWDIVHENGFTHLDGKLYRHNECGQVLDMT